MMFRVIEGGGRPVLPAAGTVEEARAEIIDRVAAAIWSRQDEYPDPVYATWEEMKVLAASDAQRAHNVRTTLAQARAAIGAFKSVEPHDPEYMLFCRGMGLNPEEYADASQALDLFVDEVLK